MRPTPTLQAVLLVVLGCGALGCGEDDGSPALRQEQGDSEAVDAGPADAGVEADGGERERARDRLPGEDGSPGLDGSLADDASADANLEAAAPDAAQTAAIPSDGLLLWLRADRGVSEVEGRVSIWADQSGKGADAVQLSASQRPRLIKAQAGAPATLEFDGVDDFLSLPAGFSDFSAGVTIFALAQSTPGDGCGVLIELSNGSEIDDIAFGRYQGKLLYEVLDSPVGGADFPPNLLRQMAVLHTSSQRVLLRDNGASVGEHTAPLPATIARSQTFVGKSLYTSCPVFSGRIAELLLYARALSDRELLTVEEYLHGRATLGAASAP